MRTSVARWPAFSTNAIPERVGHNLFIMSDSVKKIDLIDVSRQKFVVSDGSDRSQEIIRTSAMIRIAEAVEKMAQSHFQLEKDIQYYKDKADYWKREHDRQQKQAATYKGLATRHKNQLTNQQQEK